MTRKTSKRKWWVWLGIVLIFTLTFVMHDRAVYFKDEPARHIWKGLLQGEFFALIGMLAGLWIAVAGAALYWIVFDMVYNVVTLKKPLLYVGRTAQIDLFFHRVFGKLAPWAMLGAKVILLVVSLVLYQGKQKKVLSEGPAKEQIQKLA